MEFIVDIDSRKLIPKLFNPGKGMPGIAVFFEGDYPVKLDLFYGSDGKYVLIASGEIYLP